MRFRSFRLIIIFEIVVLLLSIIPTTLLADDNDEAFQEINRILSHPTSVEYKRLLSAINGAGKLGSRGIHNSDCDGLLLGLVLKDTRPAIRAIAVRTLTRIAKYQKDNWESDEHRVVQEQLAERTFRFFIDAFIHEESSDVSYSLARGIAKLATTDESKRIGVAIFGQKFDTSPLLAVKEAIWLSQSSRLLLELLEEGGSNGDLISVERRFLTMAAFSANPPIIRMRAAYALLICFPLDEKNSPAWVDALIDTFANPYLNEKVLVDLMEIMLRTKSSNISNKIFSFFKENVVNLPLAKILLRNITEESRNSVAVRTVAFYMLFLGGRRIVLKVWDIKGTGRPAIDIAIDINEKLGLLGGVQERKKWSPQFVALPSSQGEDSVELVFLDNVAPPRGSIPALVQRVGEFVGGLSPQPAPSGLGSVEAMREIVSSPDDANDEDRRLYKILTGEDISDESELAKKTEAFAGKNGGDPFIKVFLDRNNDDGVRRLAMLHASFSIDTSSAQISDEGTRLALFDYVFKGEELEKGDLWHWAALIVPTYMTWEDILSRLRANVNVNEYQYLPDAFERFRQFIPDSIARSLKSEISISSMGPGTDVPRNFVRELRFLADSLILLKKGHILLLLQIFSENLDFSSFLESSVTGNGEAYDEVRRLFLDSVAIIARKKDLDILVSKWSSSDTGAADEGLRAAILRLVPEITLRKVELLSRIQKKGHYDAIGSFVDADNLVPLARGIRNDLHRWLQVAKGMSAVLGKGDMVPGEKERYSRMARLFENISSGDREQFEEIYARFRVGFTTGMREGKVEHSGIPGISRDREEGGREKLGILQEVLKSVRDRRAEGRGR